MSPWSLLAVFALSVCAVIFWPLARAWRRGRFAFVGHKSRTPLHRLASVGLIALLLSGLAYATTYGVLGPSFFLGPPIEGPRAWFGLSLVLVGLSVMALAQAQMGDSWRIGVDEAEYTEVVSAGLYRIVRHPIYGGLLLWLVGITLFAPTPLLTLATGLLLPFLSLQARAEEQHMLSVFGESYRERMQGIGRLVPLLGRDLVQLPSPAWVALSLLLYLVALLDVMQLLWRPWVPKHIGALLGALLYLTLSQLAARERRLGALIPIFVPLLPVSILALAAVGVSVGVAPDAPMVVILLVQIAAGLLGGWLLRAK